MAVDVLLLPRRSIATPSFSMRGQEPYLDAAKELAVEVVKAFDAVDEYPQPYERAALTIICYVGSGARDGRYRPQRVTSLHYILEPIYTGLIDYGIIRNNEAVYSERLVLVSHAGKEGWRIIVSELPTTHTAGSLA